MKTEVAAHGFANQPTQFFSAPLPFGLQMLVLCGVEPKSMGDAC